MSVGISIVVAGLPAKRCDEIAARLSRVAVSKVDGYEQLLDTLTSPGIDLLIIADGLNGRRASDTYALLRASAKRMPGRVWCCIAASTGTDVIAELAAFGVDRIFFQPIDTEEIVREAARAIGIEIDSTEPEADTRKSEAALAGIWARFRDSTLARIDVLESAALSLLEGKLNPDDQRAAEREAHKLAGSSGTFGFPRSSRIARELEQRFAGSQLTATDAVALSEQIIALRTDLEGVPEHQAPASGTVRAPEGLRLLLLAKEDSATGRVVMEAEGRGFTVEVADEITSARAIVSRDPPALALIGLQADENRDATLDFIQELESRVPCVPVIVLSGASDFRARVEVARRSAHGFLEWPSPPAKTVDAVISALEKMSGSRATVLALDDDPQILAAIRTLLEAVGMRVATVEEPLKFWDAAEEAAPDLILLDVDMPYISGFEICRALRQDSRFSRVPILFVTARDDAQSIQRAFDAGADDYVRKPILPAELLMRINSRLDRSRLNRELAEMDSLTGIANRRKTSELMDRFIRLARRRGDPFCVAMLDIDHFKQVNDTHGHSAGDDVLRALAQLFSKSVRSEDIVGRWGGEEFVVGLYGTKKSEGAKRIRDVLAMFAREEFAGDGGEQFHVTCSGGVAQFSVDGSEPDQLLRVADAALYEAKAAGRNSVFVAGAALSPDTTRIDVAIVDDDEALAGLLSHSMETQRLSSIVFRAGDRAVEALTGETPEIYARVILLDVDLPAVSGLDVLRALSKDRVTLKSRVIMLSARTGERDILSALQLGAIDHITKPFSLPVLMQKVRVALHDSTA